jgi:uncharacterized membrane protein required for colicin V production
MYMNIVVILVILIVGYIGLTRGFFSSMLNMLCVVVGAAVALGLWEPLAYTLLGMFNDAWMVDLVWAASLALPFAITVAILRVITDSLLGANVEVGDAPNFVGGAVCGLVAGVVTAGVVVLSISHLRVSTDFMGYTPVTYDSQGSLEKSGGLWVPAEKIVVGTYGYMSKHALATSTPLPTWRPSMAIDGSLLRTNFNEGGSRLTLRPADFGVVGRYTVAKDAEAKTTVKDLTTDAQQPARRQTVQNLDGSKPGDDSYIEGFVVNFKAGAREREGKVTIGNSQVYLLARTPDGRTTTFHPFAMISQAEGDKLDLGRWRFDSPKTFIASVGGSAEMSAAFEFLLPRGATPLALHVKGVRADVQGVGASSEYATVAARDGAIKKGSILRQMAVSNQPLDTSTAVSVDISKMTGPQGSILSISGSLPEQTLNKDDLQGLRIEGNRVAEGEAKFDPTRLRENRYLPRELQVNKFVTPEDTVIVTIPVGPDNRTFGLVSDAAASVEDTNQPPVLIDASGQRYPALGFAFLNAQMYHVRYFPGNPISSLDQLPSVSMSKPDEKLYLVFQVSAGVDLTGFAIGNKLVAKFSPPASTKLR